MRKHILIISQYFYPEQFRINDIASEWVKRGYQVTVITGIPNYPEGKFFKGYSLIKKRKENYNGIEIIRIPIIPRGENFFMLSLNYLSFVISGYFWKIFTHLKVDDVFIFGLSPITLALPGIWISQKRKIPCYLYVQDLWPESLEVITGIKNKYIINLIGKMVDYIYKRCTQIFTTSESFVTAIEKRKVSREKIKYWPQYAEDFYQPVKKSTNEKDEDQTFKIVFAGNIGNAQGLEILPMVAKRIKELTAEKKIRKIVFNIIGDGRYKEALMESVRNENLQEMFNFIPKKPAREIPSLLSQNDVAFLCLTKSPLFSMTIPAKLQTYLACGMPIIASAEGETETIIKNAQAGICAPSGSLDFLAEAIMTMESLAREELVNMGKNARDYYLRNFDKEVLLDQMDCYFEEAE